MKLLVEFAMIFFGTLMAAALVALGEPVGLRWPATIQGAPQATQSPLAPARPQADAGAPAPRLAR